MDTLGGHYSAHDRDYGSIKEESLAGADSQMQQVFTRGGGGQEQDGAGSSERKERGHFTPGAAQAKHSGRKESHVMQRSVWPFGVPRARPRMET